MLLALIIILAVFAIAIAVFIQQPPFGKAPAGERLERVKNSPNYKNGSFQNIEDTPDLAEGVNMLTVLWSFLFNKTPRQVPTDHIPSVQTDLRTLDIQTDVLVWFGHSSYFLQADGKRFLVDPVFNGNASPVSFTTKSFPGTTGYHASDMPAIDYLIITHDHWDHLDYNTVKKLEPTVKQVICPLGVGAHLEHWGYPPTKITELDWHELAPLAEGFTLRATPARHFSGRGLKRNGTLWASFVLNTPSRRIFIGGDSGYGSHFQAIGNQYGPFDLAILENGQYNAYWIYIHMLPHQVVLAAKDLGAKRLLPVHNSKFPLAMHAWDEPLILVSESSKNTDMPLLTPQIGQPVYLSDSTQVFNRWWDGVE
ncbi:MBL fold metallo-hydrolase [Parapedobacter sp. ISTM3]|uniref:L-ascorbate metabolism protein UlaG, beta-lactamase superfamily n=2 Tax=Sphingobacteriaceae TaxID=84566 RepID=A0A1T5AGR4_9SPHI|nr:MBL fold metallo-hydrolase [Parapedobacter sp. ISTM3]SKB34154.1 L-ascorbate metabolism protein UlaG, beta-lactamase superfamily [Parapedobacter luteus]